MCAFTDFNTSYVVVQQISPLKTTTVTFHFNTSYVVVQLPKETIILQFQNYFNTSYVVVQHLFNFETTRQNQFQYILCCGSTQELEVHLLTQNQISIHLMLWFNHCWYVIAIFYYTEVLLK